MYRYRKFDFRSLLNIDHPQCNYNLHQSYGTKKFDTICHYSCQEDHVDQAEYTKIFTNHFMHPEVFTVTINDCTVGPRPVGVPRFWPILFSEYYALNFISDGAKQAFEKQGALSQDGDDLIINTRELPVIHIPGKCVWFFAFNNMDHLIRETLPSLLTLRELDYKINELTFITPQLSDSLLQFMQALGIPPQNILQFEGRWLSFDELIIPCFTGGGHLHTPTEYYKRTGGLLRERCARFLDKEAKPKRIFVSRCRASTRRILNETNIINDLRKRGFSIIDPGNFSRAEQVAMFSQAEVIVGQHGMGLASTIASEKGKLLVEIMSTSLNKVSYFRTAQYCRVAYGCYYVEALPLKYTCSNAFFGDILIDAKKFFAFLDPLIDVYG